MGNMDIPAATPPMATTDRCPSDETHDIDAYCLRPYVPLSNLPTPPCSSHAEGKTGGGRSWLGSELRLQSCLIGPAIHLRNMVPSSVSLIEPSVQAVYSILVNAELPMETIALAACILDSLNSRFARLWRQSCPPLESQSGVSHIDAVRPEVIILAALIIAVKFLDDRESTTKVYSRDWGCGLWTCEQINTTQQSIMQNLGYRLLPLWKKDLIDDALWDMDTAGKYADQFLDTVPLLDLGLNTRDNASQQGVSALTPAPTPPSEIVNRCRSEDPLRSVSSYDLIDDARYDVPTPESLDLERFPEYNELVTNSFL